MVKAVIEFDPAFGEPVFSWIAGAGNQGDAGTWDGAEEILLPRTFCRPRAEIPFDGLPWNLEVIKKLEKMLLDMIDCTFGQVVIVDDPVEFASPRRIQPDFHRSPTQGGEDGCLEVALQIQHDIKRAIAKLGCHLNESRQTGLAAK